MKKLILAAALACGVIGVAPLAAQMTERTTTVERPGMTRTTTVTRDHQQDRGMVRQTTVRHTETSRSGYNRTHRVKVCKVRYRDHRRIRTCTWRYR